MPVELNHTIVHSRDKRASAVFLARILGLGAPSAFGHFITVELDNGVSLDFDDAREIRPQHYAFLGDEESFDAIFARVKAAAIPYFADPGHRRQGEINTLDNGRGFYFSDPSGHNLEILTRSYGSAG
ncbi:VOC family protein [Sulfobacillus harzensis]|uniref:VOC family protein n=1 Tax=Sulfobacillus harzensis TaxID=2729629 RepID=A0A7Y0Q575_9FIRM|nr:VOC family protein [Sulfobacillus harzensis]NMP25160.1 VOC family protein [Sulfobacillus harzensis]